MINVSQYLLLFLKLSLLMIMCLCNEKEIFGFILFLFGILLYFFILQ